MKHAPIWSLPSLKWFSHLQFGHSSALGTRFLTPAIDSNIMFVSKFYRSEGGFARCTDFCALWTTAVFRNVATGFFDGVNYIFYPLGLDEKIVIWQVLPYKAVPIHEAWTIPFGDDLGKIVTIFFYRLFTCRLFSQIYSTAEPHTYLFSGFYQSHCQLMWDFC